MYSSIKLTMILFIYKTILTAIMKQLMVCNIFMVLKKNITHDYFTNAIQQHFLFNLKNPHEQIRVSFVISCGFLCFGDDV